MPSHCSFGRNHVQWDDSGGPGSVSRGRDLRWASWRGHCSQWHHHVSSRQTRGQNSCTTLPLHFTYMPLFSPCDRFPKTLLSDHEDKELRSSTIRPRLASLPNDIFKMSHPTLDPEAPHHPRWLHCVWNIKPYSEQDGIGLLSWPQTQTSPRFWVNYSIYT